MNEGGSTLYKQHSNVESLEFEADLKENHKSHSQNNSRENGKNILRTSWDKFSDAVKVELNYCTKVTQPLTKQKILSTLSRIYGLLGWTSSLTKTGKLM